MTMDQRSIWILDHSLENQHVFQEILEDRWPTYLFSDFASLQHFQKVAHQKSGLFVINLSTPHPPLEEWILDLEAQSCLGIAPEETSAELVQESRSSLDLLFCYPFSKTEIRAAIGQLFVIPEVSKVLSLQAFRHRQDLRVRGNA